MNAALLLLNLSRHRHEEESTVTIDLPADAHVVFENDDIRAAVESLLDLRRTSRVIGQEVGHAENVSVPMRSSALGPSKRTRVG
jgi:hypothetical protein